ncbi:MAG: PAS domain-containing protein [Alphaproteobacteria bacterium]|nr:PAS domain-containing protein [Alphaproteobacteria bacterium]
MTAAGDDAATERALARAQLQLALTERVARVGSWRMDLRTGETTWSEGLYALLGMEPQRMSASPGGWILESVEPDDVAASQAEIARAIDERRPFRYRTRTRSNASHIAVCETQGDIEYDTEGNPVALIAVCSDVTELADKHDVMVRIQEWYRCLADQASDIIILYNSAGEVIFASDALQRLLGRSPADIGGGRFVQYVHPEDLHEANRLVANPAPGETLTATYRVRHNDGHYLWMESTSRGIYAGGRLLNIIGVSRDITARKRQESETAKARDEAVAANIAKSTFLANMSHELRTPLNAIIGFAEIMRRQMFGPLGSEQYADYAHLIHESGQLLLELISDVLDMAKIEAGKLELNFEMLPLNLIIEDCLRLIEERARQNAVSLVTRLADAVPTVEADRRAIKQILLNLLSNAVKFTMRGGCITVRTGLSEGGLLLSVEDDGVGIPAEDLPRLGSPFEQARTDATLSAGGAGLGLALVRALAEKHGGWLRIESEQGLGTTVKVWLPRTQHDRLQKEAAA